MRIHPQDAAARGIATGDVVRLFNARGACLAAAIVSDDVRPGVAQLATGAWYDPDDPAADTPLCVHGNPNVLTRDAGTSRLAQGCTGQLCRVEIERYNGTTSDPRLRSAEGRSREVVSTYRRRKSISNWLTLSACSCCTQ